MQLKLNPPAISKINWTQVVAAAAMLAAVFGIEMSAEKQVAVVATIGIVSNFVTFVLRTWFTAKPAAE